MSEHDSTRASDLQVEDIWAPPHRFLKLAEVKLRVALSKTEIYARIKEQTFPKPVHLSPCRVAWIESEIVAWMEGIIAQRKAAT